MLVYEVVCSLPELVDVLSDLGDVVLRDPELLGLLLLCHDVPAHKSSSYHIIIRQIHFLYYGWPLNIIYFSPGYKSLTTFPNIFIYVLIS